MHVLEYKHALERLLVAHLGEDDGGVEDDSRIESDEPVLDFLDILLHAYRLIGRLAAASAGKRNDGARDGRG